MALSTDNDADCRFVSGVRGCAGFTNLRELQSIDVVKLSLRNTIAEIKDLLREGF